MWCTASLYQEWGHATKTSTSWSSGRTLRESTAAWSTRYVIITLMTYTELQKITSNLPPSSLLSPSLQNVPGVVECLKIITKTKSLRIADYAFRAARATGRRRVTAVHKANIMSVCYGSSPWPFFFLSRYFSSLCSKKKRYILTCVCLLEQEVGWWPLPGVLQGGRQRLPWNQLRQHDCGQHYHAGNYGM